MAEVYAGSRRAQARRTRARRPRVEVRRGERGIALRVDGTFASWYAPGSPATGSVWEALALPLLLLPPDRRRRVLVLGLGGGSAARVVRALAPRAHIVGVERDPEVIRAAQSWFDLDEIGVDLVEGDAFEYLKRGRRRFDLVIEDIFEGSGRAVRKPSWLPAPGLSLASRRVATGGILVSNTIDETEAVARELRRRFPGALEIGVDDYDNRVVAAGPRALSGRQLRAEVAAHPVLAPALQGLSFRTRPIRPRPRKESAGPWS